MGPDLFDVARRHGLSTPGSGAPYVPRPGSLAAEYVLALSKLRSAERRARAWRSVALLAVLGIGLVATIGWLS